VRLSQVALPLALFFALVILCAPAQAERRTALVIGNGAYKNAPLKNPVNDARDMAAALKSLGFDVTMITDATQQQMENAVRDFGTKLRQGGVGLFYYAGHGVQVAGENFLIPVNAAIHSEGDVKYGSVNAGLVLAKMEDAGNGLNLVFLDACRSNPYARSFRTANEGLAKMDAPTGSLISYATAPGSIASDGSGRNGVFTRHLLENMKTPGLPISEVLMRVRQGVVRETAKKQVPWEASSLIGQFSFAGGAQTASLGQSVAVGKSVDLAAERKRLTEESERLKQEQQELLQLQALKVEKSRLEIERQKVEQAKQLAQAPVPKLKPGGSGISSRMAPDSTVYPALPEGFNGTKTRAAFHHQRHEDVKCALCHHRPDARGNVFASCSSKGCHDNFIAKRSKDSFCLTFHDIANPNSCVGCHKVKKESKRNAPTVCGQCHPK